MAERFRLIDKLADRYSVAWLCRLLEVGRSSYYARRQRQEAPEKRATEISRLTSVIEAVFQQHRTI